MSTSTPTSRINKAHAAATGARVRNRPGSSTSASSADASGSDLIDAVDETAIVRDARTRIRGETAAPDRRSGLLTGGSFIFAVLAWLILAPPPGIPVLAFLACVIAHVAASSVEFEIGPGSALPTMPVLVVALFILPPQLVPVVAASGLLTAAILARLRDRTRRERLLVLAGSGWHAVGPAAVFAIARVSGPDLGQWPIFALAIGAQFLFDAMSSWVRNSYGLGVPTKRLAGALRFTFLADLLLAPIGLAAAIAVPGSPAALLFLFPPMMLLAMLQRDRRQQINRTLTLGDAVAEAGDRARRDVLTSLPNRLAWEEAIARYAEAPISLAVILADVDGLKAANDTFGHSVGDALLVAVSEIVAGAKPPGDDAIAARLGGDEFGILLVADAALRAPEVARALRSRLTGAARVGGTVPVSASVGLGTASSGTELARAFVEADRALYENKRRRGVSRG
jgi:diguanylate cyclase (GGDEF)-like protein